MCNLQIIDVVSEMFEERTTGKYIMTHIFCDGEEMTPSEVVGLLNEQQATINKLKSDIEETEISIKLFEDDVNRLSKENEQLRQELQKKQEEEHLYANEIVKLNKEAKEVLDFKSLGGDY